VAISSVSGSRASILSLQSQLQRFRANQLARQQAATYNNFSHKVGTQRRVGREWEALRPTIDEAAGHLEDLIARAEVIKGYVRKLGDLENRARTGSASQIAEFVVDFDKTLRSLNAAANATSQDPNLIGGTFSNSYAYLNDISGGEGTFPYNDLSSNYSIVDSGGNIWAKSTTTERMVINGVWIEGGSDDSVLTQYDSSGTATGKSAIITQDLQFNSLSGSTLSFTQLSTSTTYAASTLSSTGLNILDSWAYAGLATSAGRARAATTIDAALTTVNAKIQGYESALTRANFDRGFAEVHATGANGRISNINSQQLLTLQEQSQATVRNNEATNFAINRNTGLRESYMALLKTGSTGSYVNIRA